MSKKKPKPISTEEFDAALTELLDEASTSELLSIPGIYEIVSEHFNNEAIKLALDNREEES